MGQNYMNFVFQFQSVITKSIIKQIYMLNVYDIIVKIMYIP